MPTIVTTNNTYYAGTKEMARLLNHAATSLPSTYSCSATGAAQDNQDIVDALENFFGYSSSFTEADYDYATVISELKQGRPVILTAYRSRFLGIPYNGHAWVAEGQRSGFVCTDPYNSHDGYRYFSFFMNWGWDSAYNGWFAGSGWDPGQGNYQYKTEMVFGIKPN